MDFGSIPGWIDNVIQSIAIIIPIIGGFMYWASCINRKLDNHDIRINNIEKDQSVLQDKIDDLKAEMLRSFGDLKADIATKKERDK